MELTLRLRKVMSTAKDLKEHLSNFTDNELECIYLNDGHDMVLEEIETTLTDGSTVTDINLTPRAA